MQGISGGLAIRGRSGSVSNLRRDRMRCVCRARSVYPSIAKSCAEMNGKERGAENEGGAAAINVLGYILMR